MKSIKLPLQCGSIYFLLMAIAHAVGLKIPGLFIYFNVPSYAYQDKIISLLAFGWAAFFFTASTTLSRSLIKSILIIGLTAIAMLVCININNNFAILSEKIDPNCF